MKRALALALACPALAAAAAPARAADAPIVVAAPHARAVIERHPFRIRIQDGRGRAALSEVANGDPAPQVEPPTADPIAPGYDNPSTTTLYAPLSFTVGNETVTQQPDGEWVGNLLTGTRSGVQFSARDVISVARSGDAVRLVVSTSDPTGRRLAVTVAPEGDAAIHVSVRPDPVTGVALMGDSFASGADEGFFGFGGRHDALDQRGNVFSSFINEENLKGQAGPAQGPGQLSLFPNGLAAAYYPQAEFFSSRPYGFLLDQPQLARFKLDADRPDAWNVTASAPALDYVVAPGAAPRAIRTVTAVTGRQPVPPRWGLGPMWDRLAKNFGETQQDYETNLAADLRDIRHYAIPLTAFRIEGWGDPNGANDGLSLPAYTDPATLRKTIAELRRRGIHPLLYVRPWLQQGSKPVQDGLAVKTASGQPYYQATTGKPFALIDFTNPAAVRYWQRLLRTLFDMGADGFMQDYGEQVMFDMRFADGTTGVTRHNEYPTLYARATRQEVDRYQRAHPGRHLFFFTRAGYTGRPGATAYESANFPGDETTDWGHESGLRSLTTDMLSRAVGGAYGFGTDIGGYFDYTTPPTTKELFLRWTEWAALSPVFRLHGSGFSGTHTPQSFGAAALRTYIQQSRLHLKAVPLIMRLWRAAKRTGVPVTRPLWLQYPSDREGWKQDQEWLLGPDVLVAPVVVEGARSRDVYFPQGCWRAAAGGRRYRGPRHATVAAPLGRLPYFTRCGTHPFGARAAAKPVRHHPHFTG